MAKTHPSTSNGSFYRRSDGRLVINIDRRIPKPTGGYFRLRKVKILPKGFTEEKARAAAIKMEADLLGNTFAVAAQDGWDDYVEQLYQTNGSWLHVALSKARTRTKNKHLATLTTSGLKAAMLRSRGRCELTGLRFSLEPPSKGQQRPFFHSIDRIDSSKGYTMENIRIVCFAANAALNAWGEAVFREIACGYVFNRYSATTQGMTR